MDIHIVYTCVSLYTCESHVLPFYRDNPPDPYSLYIGIQEHLYPFLQSAALFFHCLSGINFVHSSGVYVSMSV